jgi:hypothetical protein
MLSSFMITSIPAPPQIGEDSVLFLVPLPVRPPPEKECYRIDGDVHQNRPITKKLTISSARIVEIQKFYG